MAGMAVLSRFDVVTLRTGLDAKVLSRPTPQNVRRGEDTLIVAHNGSLSLILSHFGLAEDRELMNHDYNWFFQHGTYSAIRVDENGAELTCFNK